METEIKFETVNGKTFITSKDFNREIDKIDPSEIITLTFEYELNEENRTTDVLIRLFDDVIHVTSGDNIEILKRKGTATIKLHPFVGFDVDITELKINGV